MLSIKRLRYMRSGDEIRFQIYQIMTNDIVKLILDIHYYFNKNVSMQRKIFAMSGRSL